MEEDTTTPSHLQKRSRVASEDDEAGDTGAARGSSRLATGIDGVIAEEKPEKSLFIQEEEEEEPLMNMEEPDRTPDVLREINDLFYFCCAPADDGAGDGARTPGSCAADLEPVDVKLTLGGKGPFVTSRKDAVDTTLRLGLGPHSKAPNLAALLGEDDDDSLQLHLHGVPFRGSPAGTKLDPTFWCPLPSLADPSTAGLDLNQPCPSKFPDDDIAADVDEVPRETPPEQRHQSSTPYNFI